EVLEEITTVFRYNDAVLRNLVIKRKEAVTEMSDIQKAENENRERKARATQRVRPEAAESEESDNAGSEEEEEEDINASEDLETDGQ
ncbi:MAG: hypothetical protein RQ899_08005, partial [Pseudomonadales bacterium]|nr:hypothetical protein [Pseudomonadales bacterium]